MGAVLSPSIFADSPFSPQAFVGDQSETAYVCIEIFFEFLKQCHGDKGKIFLSNPVKDKLHSLRLKEADKIFDRLEYWLDRRLKKSKWVFPGKEGRPITSRALYNVVTNILRRSGVPLATPHSFRKARATELYVKTKDLLRVRDYLGHSDTKVTQTYIDKKTLQREYH